MPQYNEETGRSSAQKLDFEQLLLEISSLFINLPVDSVDKVIEDTQQKISGYGGRFVSLVAMVG